MEDTKKEFEKMMDQDLEEEKQESKGEGKTTVVEKDFLECVSPAKKKIVIFFLQDGSGSMHGIKIGTLNTAMEEMLPEMIGVGGADAEVYIAVLEYDDKVTWITPKPVLVEEFQKWPRLTADGRTSMGAAFEELNRKLSRSEFMSAPSVSFAPVIFMMTDGQPNDDWETGLNILKKNKWFQYALKIGVGIGEKANMDVLREFTGDPELAIQTHGAKELKKLIRFLPLTSTQIGSKSVEVKASEGQVPLTEADVANMKKEELKKAVRDFKATELPDSDDVKFEEGW